MIINYNSRGAIYQQNQTQWPVFTWFGVSAATAVSTLPIRSQIRNAALYALRNRLISGGEAIAYKDGNETTVATEGYYNTVARAYDPPRDYERFDEFPCFNVSILDENSSVQSHEQCSPGNGNIYNSFTLEMTGYIQDNNDPALAQDKLLADVQKYFGINYWIPDSEGRATATVCSYESCEPFGTEDNRPRTGVIIRYKVWYDQKLTNPSQSG